MTRQNLAPALAAALWLACAVAQAVTCQDGIPASNPDAIYTPHGDGTVTDTRTGLMWKQCLEGYGAANCAADGGTTTFNWEDALIRAENHTFAGHSDWRLPNIKELRSLVEECRVSPAINDDVFKNDVSSQVWSGSPFFSRSIALTGMAWYVHFGPGYAYDYGASRSAAYYVRLVRSEQPVAPLPALSAVALQGTPTASSATVAGTSSLAATGYWLVVPQGSTAPTPAQVKAQAAYGSVTPAAQGSAAMQAATPASFAITGLGAATDYDFYLVADAAGQLSTPVQKVAFTTAAAPVAGTCGSAHNTASTPLLASAPAANLCNAGSPGPITGGITAWDWTCSGSPTATCQAPRGYTVTPTAGAGGGISPATAQTVAYGATPSFTVTPDAGHAVASVTGCGGTLAGSTFTTGAVTAACTVSATFAPITHAVTATASPVAGGSAVCSGSVNQGATATCTATANASYQFHGWTGACAGQGAVCSLANVTASQASVALFTQQPAGLTLPEGPHTGEALGLALQPGNGWQVTQAGTETVASLSAPALPPGVTLPHGVVRLELRHGTQASTATVVLTYPQVLPAGAAYYKYGKTRDDATPHWYAFPGAAISGNTVTLTLKDGWAGDGDVTENGVIQDPGGVALVAASPAATAAAIPTLGEWALALLAGALGLFSLGALRRRA